MKNKTLEFVKHGMYSMVPFVAGGIAGAELSDLVTDSSAVISAVSTMGQYILGYPSFMVVHARDNSDDYRTNNRWDSKKLLKGLGKTILALGPAEVVYIGTRTFLTSQLLNEGYSPTVSSIAADAVAIPLFYLAAIPLARKLRLIKETASESESEAE